MAACRIAASSGARAAAAATSAGSTGRSGVVIATPSLPPATRAEVEVARPTRHAIEMDRHELIATLRIDHDRLRAVIDGLSDADLARAAQGEWTRGDTDA